MQENEKKALCVSIHDVSPYTWKACSRLRDAIRAIAPVPLTLLVVPDYHRLGASDPPWYRAALDRCLADGDELALHGYSHLDEMPDGPSLASYLLRRVYTTSEGEFAAVDATEASRRIQCGLDWFRARGWPVQGFVAPAWLMSDGAWQALFASRFLYTTTMRRFYVLPDRQGFTSPALVYGARNCVTRSVSRLNSEWLAWRLSRSPLIRFGLHPADADHPGLMRHLERLIEMTAARRTPMTKAGFAAVHLSATGVRAPCNRSRR